MYIVIDTVTEQEYSQGYGHNDLGGYSSVKRFKVTEFKNDSDLINYLERFKVSNGDTRKVFKAEELAVKTTVTVELVKR